MAVLAVAFLLGDQRRFTVVLARPSAGESIPATAPLFALTFSHQPSRDAFAGRLTVDPPVPGSIRWRGRSLEYVFDAPLAPGAYTVSLEPGALGHTGERLRERFTHTFTVRAPGVAVVANRPATQALVLLRQGEPPRDLFEDHRIRDVAVSPDGASLAVVAIESEEAPGFLVILDATGGEPRYVVDSPDIDIGSAVWSPDGATLLVVRRDRLSSGAASVPRAWILRTDGQFVRPVDLDGVPTQSAAWSPDGQSIAFVSPSADRLVVTNIASGESTSLGSPRGGLPAWSADSRYVAWDATPGMPSTPGEPPLQQVRVKSLDGSVDRSFGARGESRSRPQFLDADTVVSMRRAFATATGARTDLVFESVATGRIVRAVELVADSTLVLEWNLDPSARFALFAARFNGVATVVTIDLETGARSQLATGGDAADWVP